GRDAARLDADQRSAADGTAAEMHEVPLVGHAVARRIHAHRRDEDAIGEFQRAQLERREEAGHGSTIWRMKDSVLTIRAGARAMQIIKRDGLDAAMVEIVPGAAGGPKGLGIAGLDRAIFGEWLAAAPRVRHLIGASIGAWRFAAACCPDPVAMLRAFAEAYTRQSYPPRS